MKYHQRDIVEVSFLFPDGTFKPHPAIIVSNDELQEVTGNIERDVQRRLGCIKQKYFDEIVDKIIVSIF